MKTANEFVTFLMDLELVRMDAFREGDWDRVDFIDNAQADVREDFKRVFPIQYADWLER